MPTSRTAQEAGDRLAKVIARSGLCSRRDAETWIAAGRVSVNGAVVKTPAFNVTERDKIAVDGAPLADRQGTRVWLYHKPAGLVVTEKDPEGRPTVFESLAEHGLPRVVTIGRLDINTEGLLLLTNDGGLKRVLELPATGWLRRYRVRAHGTVTQAALDRLKDGTEIEGIRYGPIEAVLEREQGANVWLVVALREGKNREVKNVLGALGLQVNRLIRVSFGPFQLGDIPVGGIETVKARVLREQLGKRLAEQADVDFESELPEREAQAAVTGKPLRERTSGRGTNTVEIARQRFRFTDRAEQDAANRAERPRQDRPGRFDPHKKPPRRAEPEAGDDAPARKVHFDDGREAEDFVVKTYGKKPRRDDKPGPVGRPRSAGDESSRERPPAGKRFGDKNTGEKRFADRNTGEKRFGEKRSGPRAFASKGQDTRTFADKPRASRSESPGGARSKRTVSVEGRPARTDRTRPSYSDKPRAPRAPTAGDRPRAATAGGKPTRFSGKEGVERPKREFGDRSRAPSPQGPSPRPNRAETDRPRAPRPSGEGAEARPARTSSRPQRTGDRPDKKPYSPRPSGDKPARRGGAPGGASKDAAAPRRPGAGGKPFRKPGGGGPSGRAPAGKGPPRTPRPRP